jgi:hypothetical protein
MFGHNAAVGLMLGIALQLGAASTVLAQAQPGQAGPDGPAREGAPPSVQAPVPPSLMQPDGSRPDGLRQELPRAEPEGRLQLDVPPYGGCRYRERPLELIV